MIGPGLPPPVEMDPWGVELGADGMPGVAGTATTAETAALWRERERRQRSVRFLMMFLLMLLLMDGEEQQQRRRSHDPNQFDYLRKRSRSGVTPKKYLDRSVFEARIAQEKRISQVTATHRRYKRLVQKNNDEDVQIKVIQWAEQHAELEKDEFAQDKNSPAPKEDQIDPEDDKKVMHYPWNATGFYRGEWVNEAARDENEQSEGGGSGSNQVATKSSNENKLGSSNESNNNLQGETKPSFQIKSAIDIEDEMLSVLELRQEPLGMCLLPPGLRLNMGNGTIGDDFSRDTHKGLQSHQSAFLRGTTSKVEFPTLSPPENSYENPPITLTKTSGRAAFQLYARSVPAIQEISLVDGFVKLYDSNTVGYSTRRDILLRVTGVIVHSIGRISLVANARLGRSAFVVATSSSKDTSVEGIISDQKRSRRRLQDAISSQSSIDDVSRIRDESIALYPDLFDQEGPRADWRLLASSDDSELLNGLTSSGELSGKLHRSLKSSTTPDSVVSDEGGKPGGQDDTVTATKGGEVEATRVPLSNVVFPFPFVRDDEDHTIRRTKTPAARRMPPREQLLEANAGNCEFEINMDVNDVEWSVGQWRSLVSRHIKQRIQLNPALHEAEVQDSSGNDETTSGKTAALKTVAGSRPRQRKLVQDEALVMSMNGTIFSPNCGFKAALNATAIRTDWENTTGKAINYSFYMMLTCLTQIVVLLRQLLHTQAQSAATRVSLLCIGWQTVLDALLCLVHIYLSLAMQPLFTAFASVAFFKLLIFCVIEMKYMAIIIQARNSNNGGNNTEILRRQIAMLHLRFYVALIASFLAFFYAGDGYRTIYILLLYSFWVPQIVQNIITEAKRPLHTYYIYGMSLTRLVAPLYIFAVQNNFLKEVYPDSPTNVFMCQLLFAWVGIQTAILIGQGRYGARFMIPARFLPPKFDYSRPIPPSLLAQGALDDVPSQSLQNERGPHPSNVPPLVPSDSSPIRTTGVARNRIKGSRVNRPETGMTAENPPAADSSGPSIDCVICYNAIDVRNRRGYMLAPCDHLFHRDCLVQWMDVKMECPICRNELPAL